MNGVESITSAGFFFGPPRVNGAAEGQSTAQQNNKAAGMESALTLSDQFLRHTMSDIGFVDLRADGVDQMKVFVERGCTTQDEQGLGLDSFAALAATAHAGAQITGDASLAQRAMGQVDPMRAAALLE